MEMDPTDAAVVSGDLPCDPKRVLVTVCQQCHTNPTQNAAPFPLVTYADTQATINGGKPIWQYMLSVVQNGVMPLPPVQIDPGDRDTLLRWLQSGAPARAAGDMCTTILIDPDAGATLDAGATDEPEASADDAGEGSAAETSADTDAAPTCSDAAAMPADAMPE